MKCAHCNYQNNHPSEAVAKRNVAIHMKAAHPEIPSGNDKARAARQSRTAAAQAKREARK